MEPVEEGFEAESEEEGNSPVFEAEESPVDSTVLPEFAALPEFVEEADFAAESSVEVPPVFPESPVQPVKNTAVDKARMITKNA